MTVQRGKKLNWLERALPEGLIVDAAWLEKHGYSRSLRHQYVSAGWLEQPARGVYRRPRGHSSWEQVVVSLQTLLRLPVSVGGRTALELQGYAHYLYQSPQIVQLYSDAKLPGWLSKLPTDSTFETHNRTRFLPKIDLPIDHPALSIDLENDSKDTLPGALCISRWGVWKWPLVLSTPERAILELIDELPNKQTFHYVDVTMEALVNINPSRMQKLLEEATSVKVKRLFLFFADRHAHRWLNHIDQSKVKLGKGKRMLTKGGTLNSKYQITVPDELNAVQ